VPQHIEPIFAIIRDPRRDHAKVVEGADHEHHVASVIRITGHPAAMCDNVIAWIERWTVRRIRIERKAPLRDHRDRYAVLPIDPRDPDILRAKLQLRRGSSDRAVPVGAVGGGVRSRS